MTSIPSNVVKALSACNAEVVKLQQDADSKADQVRVEFRMKLEKLFEARQAELAAVDGFWRGVFAAAVSPLTPLMNGTTDPKIFRALTDFSVKTSVKEGCLCRSVSMSFRPNMFAEEGIIHREIDSKLHTVALQPLKWKTGTERARQDSIFRFFSSDCQDEEFLEEVLEAFDTVFQNPFLIL